MVAALPACHSVLAKILDTHENRLGPILGHQISWRFDLPFRNYSGFNFSAVWLDNAYSLTLQKWRFGPYTSNVTYLRDYVSFEQSSATIRQRV